MDANTVRKHQPLIGITPDKPDPADLKKWVSMKVA